jgi:hypothetical protein
LVLSAFGCGAFGNPPQVVAELFREVLSAHSDQIRRVVFCILEDHNSGRWHNPHGNLAPFVEAFPQAPATASASSSSASASVLSSSASASAVPPPAPATASATSAPSSSSAAPPQQPPAAAPDDQADLETARVRIHPTGTPRPTVRHSRHDAKCDNRDPRSRNRDPRSRTQDPQNGNQDP